MVRPSNPEKAGRRQCNLHLRADYVERMIAKGYNLSDWVNEQMARIVECDDMEKKLKESQQLEKQAQELALKAESLKGEVKEGLQKKEAEMASYAVREQEKQEFEALHAKLEDYKRQDRGLVNEVYLALTTSKQISKGTMKTKPELILMLSEVEKRLHGGMFR